ncbi:PAS domain S-box protein [Maribellus sediminis]|uniref:PAS domain S-box protein n=1 Tax=Maribellus sediminis TaxID=2696285 RepID=UPI00142FB141|nr:PAS domain S-box protein [Maribellus sediminis]
MKTKKLTFTDFFDVIELQRLQDLFSDVHEIASIITLPDGTPVTKGSNFCRLCNEFVCKSANGFSLCYGGDTEIVRKNSSGPHLQKCEKAGLLNAGVNIMIGDNHIGNWIIGQVRDNAIDREEILKYANEAKVDQSEFLAAYNEVQYMTAAKLKKIAGLLSAFVKELSDRVLINDQLRAEKEKTEKVVLQTIEKERKLESALSEIKIISENLPNIIWKAEITSEGNFVNTYISDIADELLELPAGTIGNSFEKFFSYIVPEYLPKLKETIAKGLSHPGRSYAASYQVIKGNKESVWFESTGKGYIFDGKVQIFGITVDITENKQIENELKESELLLSQSQKVANIGSYYFDIESGHWISTAYLDEIFGIDETFPKNVTGWLEIIHPEDRIMMQEYLLSEVIEQGKPFNKEYRIINKKDGHLIWIHGLGRLEFNQSGQPVKMIGTIQNINERKQANELLIESETRYRSLLENLPVGVFRSTLKGEVLSANSAMAKIYGYQSVEELLKVPAADYYARENPREFVISTLLEKGALLDYQTLEYRKDGSLIWVSANYKLTTDEVKGESYIDGVIQDITERKKTEEAISVSEEKFRSITEQTSDFIGLTDENGIITYASPTANKLFECPPEEMIGRNFLDFVEASDASNAVSAFGDVMRTGKKLRNLEFTLKRKDGSTFICELNGSQYNIASTKGTIVNIRDISKRKQAEIELQKAKEEAEENEKRFEALHNASFGGIAIHDKGKILDCNQGLSTMTGYNHEELIGMDGLLLIAENSRQQVMDNILSEYEMPYETIAVRKSGEEFPVRLEGKMIPYEGKKVRVVEFRDITEIKKAEETLRQSEENFRLLVSNTFDGILISDKNGNYLYANKKAAEITGYSIEELIKINTRQLTPERFRKAVEQKIADHFSQSSEQAKYEAVLVQKSGKEILIEITSSLTSWKGVQAQIISFRDITLRKKNELELLEAKLKAEESDRLKSAFLANMSHEIRTPMNGILGFTDLLQDPELSGDEQQSYIEIIKKSGNRLLDTVNDIIEISKIETGQVSVSLNEINVNDQLDYLYNFFSPEVQAKGMQLVIRNNLSSAQSVIVTDEVKLHSILSNLIKNAIKFTNSGSISISCNQIGRYLQFDVTDTGIGIPQKRLDAIFDRFVQADISDTRVHEGSGLGLAISKSYAEMLGGSIGVESEVDKGSRFYFTIEFIPVETLTGKEKRKVIKKLAEPENYHSILVAEDEDISYLLIKSILSNENYRLLRAKNGAEAVALVRNNAEIKMILMDLKMPEMDGYEATKRIREFNPSIPIIAQTAHALFGDMENALKAGCNDYVSKPINKEVLLEKIEKLIKK